MDALALLCTLHADGPATLKRLRRCGCGSLEAFAELSAEHLAQRLELEPAAARRLLREARYLLERVDDTPSDREEAEGPAASPLPGAEQKAPLPTRAEATRANPPRPRPALDNPPEPVLAEDLRDSERAIVGRVLERWRRDDDEEADAPLPPELQAELDAEDEAEESASMGAQQPLQTLRVGEIDGLDAELVERLGRAGIHSLEALADADAVGLSGSLRMAFAQVRRIQFFARRRAPAPAPAPRARAATRPAMSAGSPGAEIGFAPPAPTPAAAPSSGPAQGGSPLRSAAPVPTPARDLPAVELPRPAEQDDEPTGCAGGGPTASDAPRTDDSGTVLDWNFEIPAPPERRASGDEGSSGPFA